jgi:peptidoglycan lytic transglycosylase G
MPFSDEDEPSRSRRRRGRGRSQDDAGFDDFWTRETIGPSGRSRRRRSSDDGPTSPGDVSDLTGDVAMPDSPPAPADRPPRGARPRRGGRVPDRAPSGPAAFPVPGPDQGAGTVGPPPRSRRVRPTPTPGGGRPNSPPPRYPVGAQAALERRRALEQGAAPGAVLPPAGYASAREPDPVERVRRGGPAATPRRWPGGERYGDDRYGADRYGSDSYSDDTYDDDYDDYDDAELDELDELSKRRGCRRALTALAVLAVVAMVAGWFGWSWVQGEIDPAGPPGDTVLVEIPEGTSTAGIGDVLTDAGVISNATVWDWYTKVHDVGTIKAGRYEMQLDSSFDEAIDALKAEPLPPDVERLVTVPPGLTQAQIATRLADPEDGAPGFTAEAVQAALADPASRSGYLPADQASLEGTLYPETYAFEEGDTPAVFVQRMVQQFDQVATELDLNGRSAALGITPYQALIVASMVEREATVADGPRVARVIYNRWAAGQPLGIDATSCYEKNEIPCELTTAELEDNTPYDTRLKLGLPPTPIASPGRDSLYAALNPADGDWLWYVLDVEAGDGSSLFTNDYDEFVAAKERCVEAGQCG